MYFIPIHVPIYKDGERLGVTTEWKRSLELLRNSLGGRFGPLCVLAPCLPWSKANTQIVLPVTEEDDGIRLVPSIDPHVRLRRYWFGPHQQYQTQARELLPQAQFVHTGLNESFRPYPYYVFRWAVKVGKPTLFVQDQDIVAKLIRTSQGQGLKTALKGRVAAALYERMCRRGVALADLVFLKGKGTLARYGALNHNIREIQNTSYRSDEIVSETEVRSRLEDLFTTRRPIRLAFCGRLIDIKGVDRSLRLIARARHAGAVYTFDVIGGGPERASLERLASELGIADVVHFRGMMPYGSALIHELGRFDAMLFTPTADETPRMIFDGYAAGLPLIGSPIDYVRERAEDDRAVLVLPTDHEDASPLIELARRPEQLVPLTEAAIKAGVHHAADNWYRRRAEWTFEAADRHRAACSRSRGAGKG